MNGVGSQGGVYTGTGITGQDALIYGNLLVTGGIDPTYLALTPQQNAPQGFINPLWVDSTNALRTENIIASGKFIGDLSGNSTTAVVTDVSNNSTYYPIFVDGSGNKPISVNIGTTAFTYNPSTNNLTATLFVGDLSGNFLGSITNATNANITDTNTNATYYPTFVDGSGNKPLGADISTGPLTYNPSTGELGCQRVSSTGNIITGGLFVGGLTGTINVTDTNTNATYYPTFVDGSGNKSLNADIGTGPLSYNPSTGTLTTTQLKYSTGVTGDVAKTNATGLLSLGPQFPRSVPAIGYPLGAGLTMNGYGYSNGATAAFFTSNVIRTGNAIYLPEGTWELNYRARFQSSASTTINQYLTWVSLIPEGSAVYGLNTFNDSFICDGPFTQTPNQTAIVTAGSAGLTLYMNNFVLYTATATLSGGQRMYAVRLA
jgi:hypothetical protein